MISENEYIESDDDSSDEKSITELVDADDSSDEELVKKTYEDKERKSIEGYKSLMLKYSSETEEKKKTVKYSFLLHQTGLGILYSDKINEVYYQKKYRNFSASMLDITHEEIRKIIRSTFLNLICNSYDETLKVNCMREFDFVLKNLKNIIYMARQALNPQGQINLDRLELPNSSSLRTLDVVTVFNTKELVKLEEHRNIIGEQQLNIILNNIKEFGLSKENGTFVNINERRLILEEIRKGKEGKSGDKGFYKAWPDWLTKWLITQKITGNTKVKGSFISSKRTKQLPGKIIADIIEDDIKKIISDPKSPIKKGEEVYEIASNDVSQLPANSPTKQLLAEYGFWERFRKRLAEQLEGYQWIQRGRYKDSSIYQTESPLDFIAMLRVFNRDFKRSLKTWNEERLDESPLQYTIIRQWQSTNTRFTASDSEIITTTGVRSDQVNDITNYVSIYKTLVNILHVINTAHKPHITHADIAQSIRCLLQGKKNPLRRAKTLEEIKLGKKQEATLLKIIVHMSYLMFATESMRNPASLVAHQMILDLLIEDKTDWAHALCDYNKTGKPLMPMALKDDGKTVRAARRLHSIYSPHVLILYNYPGDMLEEADSTFVELQQLESRLVIKWFTSFLKEIDKELFEKIVAEKYKYSLLYIAVAQQFNRWYNLDTSQSVSESTHNEIAKNLNKEFQVIPSDKPLKISGFGNNCGLFALALGVKIALHDNPNSLKNSELSFLSNFENTALQGETKETAEIGKILRSAISQALMRDAIFKEGRLIHFISCVQDYFVKKDFNKLDARDMEGFFRHEKNQKFMENLLSAWLTVKSLIQKYNYDHILNELSSLNVEKNQINDLLEKITQILPTIHVSNVKDKVRTLFINTNIDSVEAIVWLRKLYALAWHQVPFLPENKEQLELFNSTVHDYFKNHYMQELLNVKNIVENLPLIFKLQLLEEVTFSEKETMVTTSKEVIIKGIQCLYIGYYIQSGKSLSWDEIYGNYYKCVGDANKKVFLSGDELFCLASYWGIQLNIKYNNGNVSTNFIESSEQRLQVTLCNSSETHWEVVSKSIDSQKSIMQSKRQQNSSFPFLEKQKQTQLAQQSTPLSSNRKKTALPVESLVKVSQFTGSPIYQSTLASQKEIEMKKPAENSEQELIDQDYFNSFEDDFDDDDLGDTSTHKL